MIGIPPPTRQDIIAMLVTEHFTLQGARSATISDANGRTSFLLGMASGVTVALAFMAQISGLGGAFFVFAIVLLPALLFIGLVTFERLVQLGIENVRCVLAINRIRHYYLEVAPELRPHVTLSPHDDPRGVLLSLGSLRSAPRPWDIFVTNAGMVAVLDALVAGVIAALVGAQLGGTMAGPALAGAMTGLVVLTVLSLYLARSWRQAVSAFGVRFPSTEAELDLSHIPPASEPRASDG